MRWRALGRWERGDDRAATRRRGLSGDAAGAGVQLTTQAAQLMSFVDYCQSAGSDRITSELALQWATTTRSGSSHDGYLARRLMTYGSRPPLPDPALTHPKCPRSASSLPQMRMPA